MSIALNSNEQHRDLSGVWMGTYEYPNKSWPTTFFSARIEGDGACFEGRTEELSSHGSQNIFEVTITGSSVANHVSFLKVYDRPQCGRFRFPVRYEGALTSAGNKIRGIWRLPGLSGSFQMCRKPRAEAKAKRENKAPVFERV